MSRFNEYLLYQATLLADYVGLKAANFLAVSRKGKGLVADLFLCRLYTQMNYQQLGKLMTKLYSSADAMNFHELKLLSSAISQVARDMHLLCSTNSNETRKMYNSSSR